MKFSIKEFFGKCAQIRKKLQVLSHFLKKSFIENFMFSIVLEFRQMFMMNLFLRLIDFVKALNTQFTKNKVFHYGFHKSIKEILKVKSIKEILKGKLSFLYSDASDISVIQPTIYTIFT